MMLICPILAHLVDIVRDYFVFFSCHDCNLMHLFWHCVQSVYAGGSELDAHGSAANKPDHIASDVHRLHDVNGDGILDGNVNNFFII